MSNHAALPGFRDFYPDELAVRNHLFASWREVATRYGFEEYDGPPLEALQLYTDKSGTEIVEQLYAFTDRGGREVALRPEMTPTLARMVAARIGGMRKPVKWFSLPQLFRYERQQRGRLREHFQLNLDILGEPSVEADAELLSAALDVLRALGLGEGDVVARVSDRRILRALLLHAGVPEEGLALTYNIVDKLEREGREEVGRRLREEAGLGESVVEAVLAIVEVRELSALGERYGDVVQAELAEMETFLRHLEWAGLSSFVRFDLSIVRGLAYYTGIVWELFDRGGELRAIAGGGRYDHLLEAVGGTKLPALGFGMGDVVLGELLRDRGLLPDPGRRLDFYLVAVTSDERAQVVSLAHRLREGGHSVDYALRPQGVGRQFKNAAALGARRTVVIGPEEVAEGVVALRDMESGEEHRVPIDQVGG